MGRSLTRSFERGETRPEDEGGAITGDQTLAPLREILAPEAFREIVTLYEDTIRNTVAEIATAAGRGDCAALAGAAHDLAGMCGQIGSERCTALAREIERACAEGRSDDAAALAAAIAPAAAETLDALARYHDQPAEA